MPIRAIDHVAITVADIHATADFYRRALGAEVMFEDLYRAGKIPVMILQVGGSRLSLHPAQAPASPHAQIPTPGSVDLCFRWDGPLDAARAQLARAGAQVELGPVPRPAADGAQGHSLYFRDLDGNLLELLSTD